MWCLEYFQKSLTMSKFLYNNISFLLINLRILCFTLALISFIKNNSTFIEWTLGGRENSITATLLFDSTSFIFLRIVLFISSNVIFYRKSYMSEDPYANRFILLVFAFVISIVIIIIRPNIIRILLGWDGLGLVSYCLVIYYPTKKSRSAGILTVIRNRVGDVCILLRIGWFRILGDYNFTVWRFWSESIRRDFITYLIMLGALTKRAQIPFSAWLPAAMAAPTPVSALVHSSTLVTAGVYLLIRFSSSINFADKSMLLFIATVTIFISGLVANFEFDLKKIIALSTLSQLGIMIFAIALELYELAFFHLVIHALFKALLFLCAGTAIHRIGGRQDIRVYGGLVKKFPLIGVCLNYANISLCGLPFLAGFYSKDLIIEIAAKGIINQIMLIIIFLAVGLTVGYRTRLSFYTFVDSPNGQPFSYVCDQDPLIFLPIVNLTIFSLVSGSAIRWVIFSNPYSINLPLNLKILTLVMILSGVLIRLASSYPYFSKKVLPLKIVNFIRSLWFFPYISRQITSYLPLKTGKNWLKFNDQGWIEECTINTISKRANARFNKLEWIQNNELKIHILMYLIWARLAILLLK